MAQAQGQGTLCWVQTGKAASSLENVLAGISEKSEMFGNVSVAPQGHTPLPQEHLADFAGGNPAEGVHLELVKIGVCVVGPYVGSTQREKITS